jgi:predicted ABC-type ATPase
VTIWVLAGTNGGGKSSIGGAMIRAAGADYYDPDEAARRIQDANPGTSISDANAAAWLEGKRLLERAIADGGNYAFETSLGGATITKLLADAIAAGIEVHIWYVALASPELHLARVRARVARGGHDIPERDIRRRYDASRENLIALLPGLASLRVYDNTEEAAPESGDAPAPRLILQIEAGEIEHCDLAEVPEWAKPIVLSALRLGRLASGSG